MDTIHGAPLGSPRNGVHFRVSNLTCHWLDTGILRLYAHRVPIRRAGAAIKTSIQPTGGAGLFHRRNFMLTVAAGSLSARQAKSDTFGKRPITGSTDPPIRDFDAQPLAVKTQPDVVIFEGNYPAWPWVTRDRHGRLYCTLREDGIKDRKDTGHGFSPLGKTLVTHSDDAGQTWSVPTVVSDIKGIDETGGGLTVLPDESLMISFYSRFGPSGAPSQAWTSRSTDRGQTWSRATPTSDQDTRARSAVIAMSNGEILAPIYRSMFSKEGHQGIAAISSDHGATWKNYLVPNAPSGELNEWSVLEVEPGRIIGLHRDEDQEDRGWFWKTESNDWGRTWAEPVRTNVRSAKSSSPPQLDFHGDRVVLTYADARMVSVAMVSTTDPDYESWDVDDRLRCYQYRSDGRQIADASYPCSVAVGPHRRLIVDYEIESLITPDASQVIDYELKRERKQITGHFVDTPKIWGAAEVGIRS